MAAPRLVLHGDDTAAEAADRLGARRLTGAPVIDQRGAFIGLIDGESLALQAGADDRATIARLADPAAPTTTDADHLDSALEALLSARANWIPVLNRERRVVGILTISALVRGYSSSLRAQLRQISQIAPNTVALDSELAPGSPLVGHTIADAALPPGTIVMTLQRGADLLPCRGDTVLMAGDQLGILAHADDAELVTRLVGQTASSIS
ncbi:MAG: TrkA C-terminal domain-containing protein [Solirubrobacteraceae bacterium]